MTAVRTLDLVRHMQYFLALADELHFGRAADRLGISQPPLSQGIRRLEDRMGVTLVERGSRIALTQEGADLVPRARRLVDAATEILDNLPVRAPTVQLGVVPQLPLPTVTSLVATMRAELSDRLVTTQVAGSVDLIRRVLDGRLDVAVIEHPAVTDHTLAMSPVVRFRRWLLVPTGHRLARVRHADTESLAGLHVALGRRADNPPSHDVLADALGVADARISDVTVADDRAALLTAASGRALTLTADPGVQTLGCKRVALRGDPFPLRVRVVAKPDRAELARAVTTRLMPPAGHRHE